MVALMLIYWLGITHLIELTVEKYFSPKNCGPRRCLGRQVL